MEFLISFNKFLFSKKYIISIEKNQMKKNTQIIKIKENDDLRLIIKL